MKVLIAGATGASKPPTPLSSQRAIQARPDPRGKGEARLAPLVAAGFAEVIASDG